MRRRSIDWNNKNRIWFLISFKLITKCHYKEKSYFQKTLLQGPASSLVGSATAPTPPSTSPTSSRQPALTHSGFQAGLPTFFFFLFLYLLITFLLCLCIFFRCLSNFYFVFLLNLFCVCEQYCTTCWYIFFPTYS